MAAITVQLERLCLQQASELQRRYPPSATETSGVAEVVRYEESTTWASPQHFIDMSAGWWSMAIRLDRLSPGEKATLLERATRAIEAELGSGPLQIAGATNVLRTIA